MGGAKGVLDPGACLERQPGRVDGVFGPAMENVSFAANNPALTAATSSVPAAITFAVPANSEDSEDSGAAPFNTVTRAAPSAVAGGS